MEFKKIFLLCLIISLVVSGFMAISVFVVGGFGSIEWRILITALLVGGYSLTGLCCSTLIYKQGYQMFTYIGIAISIIGFCVSMLLVWFDSIFFSGYFWQIAVIFPVLAVASAHVSLLLLARSDNKVIKHIIDITILSIILVSSMIIYVIFDIDDTYGLNGYLFRFLGIFAVLAILGTILTPLSKKLINK